MSPIDQLEKVERAISPGTLQKKIGMVMLIIVVIIVMTFMKIEQHTVVAPTEDNKELLFWIEFTGVTILLLLAIFYWGIRKRITTPLERLQHVALQLEAGNYAVSSDIRTGDELEGLSITLNKTASSLAKAQREHREIDKAKNTFLTMASHELRSPMTPIKGQLQMLLGDYFGKLNKEQREATVIALRNAEHLDLIIQDMLELSRIDAAKIAFTYKRCDITEETRLLIKGMKSYLPEKKVTLVYKAPKIQPFECDAGRIMQVLRNLITNAIKYSPERGKIIIAINNRHEKVQFSVRDFGNGISHEAQTHMFEPFFQEENVYSRMQGGTGLGLSICRGIVEMMGGHIHFASEPGMGTTFMFTIPKVPPKETKSVNLLIKSEEMWKKALKDKLA